MQPNTIRETDKHLRDTVLHQLEWEPEVQATEIGVTAKDGVVTLTGFVQRYPEKLAAEKAAKAVYGVKAVANDIEVKLSMTRTDPEIARDVLHAMQINVSVPDEKIKTTVRNGIVTLEGTLDWNYQRNVAGTCARNVAGVRGVVNSIVVKPAVTSTEVKTKIEQALRRNAEVDARRISVLADNGAVTLYGNVRSWFEKDEAERAAWAAPGVSSVTDHIVVVP